MKTERPSLEPCATSAQLRQDDAFQQRLAEVLDAYLADMERGLPPNHEQLLARHPDLAAALSELLKGLDWMQHAAHELAPHEFPSLEPSSLDGAASRATGPLAGARRLGEYEIVREIGRGGMGIVYEARQASLQRRVALKVLPFAAVLDQKQIARFNNEARAAAQLHHPHIVPVYAVGCERGVHYYAMQYIEGRPLDQAIRELREQHGVELPAVVEPSTWDGPAPVPDAPARSTVRGLSTAESIRSRSYFQSVAELGIQAAEGLQHAHDCGVVHRDIKPSNLLLDEGGKIWIADFGLARCQSETSLTAAGDVLGTVRYMSPEQAAGRPLDERTDVYSLGVTLYELLTLRDAFTAPNRAQFVRQIEQQEPPPPRRWNSAIPVDLETIVLKAIAKSKDRRYTSARELAEDLRAFLERKTIRARRPSWSDRAGKWASRHRSLVASAAAMTLILLIGSLFALASISRSRSETRQALEQTRGALANAARERDRAQSHYHRSREMLDRLGAEHAERLASLPGAERLRQGLLRETLNYYEQFLQQADDDGDAAGADDSPLARDAARTQFLAAVVLEQLGEIERAIDAYRQATTRFERLARHAPTPDAPNHEAPARQVALCHNNLGMLFLRQERVADAEGELRRAIELHETLDRAAGGSTREADLAQSWNNLGLVLGRTDRRAEAAECLERATTLLERTTAPPLAPETADAPTSERFVDLAVAYNNLAAFHASTDAVLAERRSRAAIDILERLTPAASTPPRRTAELAASYSNLAAVLRRTGKAGESADAYGRAIRLQQQLVARSPDVVKYQADLAVMLANLGHVREQQQALDDAIAALSEAVRLQSAAATAAPQIAMFRDYLASHRHNLDRVQRAAAESTNIAP